MNPNQNIFWNKRSILIYLLAIVTFLPLAWGAYYLWMHFGIQIIGTPIYFIIWAFFGDGKWPMVMNFFMFLLEVLPIIFLGIIYLVVLRRVLKK
jgi:uncharacterized paraquat-inducible protein A